MPTIDELFTVHRAKSDLFSEYEPGVVGYVGNTTADNGMMGFVTPQPKDRVFRSLAISVSAFCDATVQAPPFIACGRAGNGLVVLEPKTHMTPTDLAHYAAYINTAVKWRFNWYRQVTADRLKPIQVADLPRVRLGFGVANQMPPASQHGRPSWKLEVMPFTLESLFDLVPGNYHSLGVLSPGAVPMVSCGAENNGVEGFYEVKKHLHCNRLTIALNGSPLATKYHPYTFAAKDDVAVCLPRRPMGLATLLFVQAMLERERWRYSYYRKCYISKLKRFTVNLPVTNGVPDEHLMHRVVEDAPYWEYLAGIASRSS